MKWSPKREKSKSSSTSESKTLAMFKSCMLTFYGMEEDILVKSSLVLRPLMAKASSSVVGVRSARPGGRMANCTAEAE